MYWILFPIKNLRQAALTAERILTRERQLTEQITGASLFLAMKEGSEQKKRTVMFDESNVMGVKIYQITSMTGTLATHYKQSKLLKPRVYHNKG